MVAKIGKQILKSSIYKKTYLEVFFCLYILKCTSLFSYDNYLLCGNHFSWQHGNAYNKNKMLFEVTGDKD